VRAQQLALLLPAPPESVVGAPSPPLQLSCLCSTSFLEHDQQLYVPPFLGEQQQILNVLNEKYPDHSDVMNRVQQLCSDGLIFSTFDFLNT